MIRQRCSFATIVVLGVAALTSSSDAFSPSSLAARKERSTYYRRQQQEERRKRSLLHVGTALPHQPDHVGKSFENENENKNNSHSHHHHGVHAPITAINSPQELADFLNQDDRICVIKFHAAWCKSCQRFGLKFQSLANDKTDWVENGTVIQEGPMRFGSIEFGANTGMCRMLQIKRLPTVHFYQGGQKLDGFPCGPSKFPMLVEKVEQFLQSMAAAHSSSDDDDSISSGGGVDGPSSLEDVLQQGDELMSSSEVAAVLEQLIEQDANGSLESNKSTAPSRGKKNKKSWWNIMP